jgi:predicted outer membrane repeat protein
LSWGTAYRFLQDALMYAADPGHGVNEIRVAQGVYTPDRDDVSPTGTGDRAASFSMSNGVTVAGGYAGFGAPNPDERDVEQYETVLSGDLAGDDDLIADDSCCVPHSGPGCAGACEEVVCGYSPYCCEVAWDAMCVAKALTFCELSCPELETNSFHVVNGAGTDPSAVLEGFTVTAGYANLPPDDSGGGLYAPGGSPTVCRCRFRRNFAEEGGGGDFGDGAPTIESCAFVENTAFSGGALHADEGWPLILDSTFSGNGGFVGACIRDDYGLVSVVGSVFADNSADQGGVLYEHGGLHNFTGCTFVGNYADYQGGAIFCLSGEIELQQCRFVGNTAGGGGGAIRIGNGTPLITNCLFNGNRVTESFADGGAIRIDGLWSAGAQIANCTITNNSAGAMGGGVYIDDEPVTMTNCLLWGNTDSGGNAESAQVFVEIDGGLYMTYSCVQGLTGALGGYANFGDDPLIADLAGPDAIPGTEDDDLHLTEGSPCVNRGNDRVGLDLGVFDLDGELRVQECDVDIGADETPFFASDCNANGIADACDLAEAMSTDCNDNGIPDDCDIAGGFSRDCNDNGLPDECDVQEDLYRVDDGTEDEIIQGNGGDLIWFNEFRSVSDNEVIVAIDICWGRIAEGTPTDLAVWVDPNDDGNPIDALLVTLVPDVPAMNPETGILNTIPIPPTFVGHTGEIFYVGAHIIDGGGDYPASVDQTQPLRRRSWAVIGDNLHQLWNNVIPPVILDDDCPACAGNWLLRARRIASGDADQNGIPDECDQCPWDLDASGDVGVNDFLVLLAQWGDDPGGPPDFDGDGDVGVGDFLELLASWGSCP